MTLSANEQYLLELMNRARLDPLAEAARFGIDLNAGLSVGQISAASKQVLAPNEMLEAAATGHSLWMLAADVFSHTGAGGSSPGDRIRAEGYVPSYWAENIGLAYTTGTANQLAQINTIHEMLFKSAGHRVNLLAEGAREVGLGAETGGFTDGRDYNATVVTEVFGRQGSAVFLTGAVYDDRDGNRFYTPGEGLGGASFAAQGLGTATAAAGGYALGLAAGAGVAVTGNVGGRAFQLTVDMSLGNVKLDVVGSVWAYASGSVVLGSGINHVMLLGLGALSATGNGLRNQLLGNFGANALDGLAGNDGLSGRGGADLLTGGTGDDRLNGGRGADVLSGGEGADAFLFVNGNGADRVADFTLAEGDRLALDDALWGGAVLTAQGVVTQFARLGSGEAVMDFGGGDVLRLTGVTSLDGLAGQIDLI